MVATKGKRRVEFQGRTYYWQIKNGNDDRPLIHIVSEDKSLFLKKGYDHELCIGPQYIKVILKNYFNKISEGSLH